MFEGRNKNEQKKDNFRMHELRAFINGKKGGDKSKIISCIFSLDSRHVDIWPHFKTSDPSSPSTAIMRTHILKWMSHIKKTKSLLYQQGQWLA